jgi:SET domain-containing protein
MILIPTRVGPSRIHGNGLFTLDDIPAGTPVWRHQPGFDQVLPPALLASLPPTTRDHVRWFGFFLAEDGGWHLSGDHACFMNHADQPNTGAVEDGTPEVTTVTLWPLRAGEELTCDYRTFDAAASEKLGPVPAA